MINIKKSYRNYITPVFTWGNASINKNNMYTEEGQIEHRSEIT